MNELTYRDYIKYLQVKTSSYQEESLSSDTGYDYFSLREQLDNVSSLPAYILDAPLLSSKEYDEETALMITEIRKTISLQSHSVSYFAFLIEKVRQLLSVDLEYFRSPVFVGVAVSIIWLSIALLSLNLKLVGSQSMIGAAGADTTGSTIDASPAIVVTIIVVVVLVVAEKILNKKK